MTDAKDKKIETSFLEFVRPSPGVVLERMHDFVDEGRPLRNLDTMLEGFGKEYRGLTHEGAKRWEAACKRFKIGGAMPVTYRIDLRETWFGSGEEVYLCASTMLPDADPMNHTYRTVVEILATKKVPAMLSDENMFQIMRQAARDLYLHELDEQIRVDGKDVFNPHKTAPRGFKPDM